MPVYTVSYTDGSRSVSGGQATATDLFEAIEQAQKWAENLAIDAPESEWSQWMIEIIDEAGNNNPIENQSQRSNSLHAGDSWYFLLRRCRIKR